MTALVMLLCLPAAEASNVDQNLVVGIQSYKTQTFTPLNPIERDMVSVYDLVYDSVLTIDDNYMPQPCLAERWEMSSNGATWTFYLRDDVRFSDGTPLTAHDVVASANYILDMAKADTPTGFYQNLKYFIKKIEVKDDYTVVVTAERRYYGVLYAMTFPVLPASQLNAEMPLGSGAYMVTGFVPGNYITMAANPNWWQQQPQVKEIMFTLHKTTDEVISSFEYGRVDAIFTRDTAASQYKSSTNTFALDSRTMQLETLLINNESYPFDDVNIRKAVRLLINADSLASTVYFGMATRTDTPMPAGTWMYNNAASQQVQTNREEAIRLLEEAGWIDTDGDGVRDKPKANGNGSNRLHIRLYVYEEPDNDVRVEVANQIADILNSVGFECVVEIMPLYAIEYVDEKGNTHKTMNMYEELRAGDFDLALVAYSMDWCPDPGFLLMSNNTGNYVRYRSEDMNGLCKELRTQTTQEGYRDVLFRIQAKFVEDCPFICLYYRDGAVLTRKMYTTVRDVREYELLRGIEYFHE